MTTEETDLTFIRCPNCRSLIPAIATRCRMCGTQFDRKDKEAAPADEGSGADAERRSRVRQRTITASPEEVDEIKRGAGVETPRTDEPDATAVSAAPPSPPASSPSGAGAPFRFGAGGSRAGSETVTSGFSSGEERPADRRTQPPAPDAQPHREEEDDEDWGDEEEELSTDESGDDEEAHSDGSSGDEFGGQRQEGKRRRRRRRKKKGQQPVPPAESFDRPTPEPMRAENGVARDFEAPSSEEDRSAGSSEPSSASEQRSGGIRGFVPPQSEPRPSPASAEPPPARREFTPRESTPRDPSPRESAAREVTPRDSGSRESRESGGREGSDEPRRFEPRAAAPASAAPGNSAPMGSAPMNSARASATPPSPPASSRAPEPPPAMPRAAAPEASSAGVRPAAVPELNPAQAEGALIGWLVDFGTEGKGTAFELRAGKFFVGRQKLRPNDMVFENPTISTPHCVLTANGPDGLHVQDLMSERGTQFRRANEQRMQVVQGVVTLHHGDWLKLGEYEVMVCLVPPRTNG